MKQAVGLQRNIGHGSPPSPMKLKTFQRGDLARAALHDGLILGLGAGLGKTICAYAQPFLPPSRADAPRQTGNASSSCAEPACRAVAPAGP